MATTTNYGWDTPDDTDLVKDGAAAIRTLGSSVDTTTKALNPETTLGDIAYRSATSNTNTRLAIGSAGQVLTVAAGVPSWASPSDQTPLTTKGDVFTFSTVDARLGVGANGTVLTADSAEATGLKWATPATGTTFAGCYLKATTNQSASSATYTVINWNAEDYDTDGYHSTSVNNSRITIPAGKAGYYLFHCMITFDSTSTTGARGIAPTKNGAGLGAMFSAPSPTVAQGVGYSTVRYMAVTDYMEIQAYQASGGSVNVIQDGISSYFIAAYLGA